MKKKLKEIRFEKGLTKRQVAVQLGMNDSVLSLKENGKRKWNLDEFVKLCRFYGVSLDDVDPQL